MLLLLLLLHPSGVATAIYFPCGLLRLRLTQQQHNLIPHSPPRLFAACSFNFGYDYQATWSNLAIFDGASTSYTPVNDGNTLTLCGTSDFSGTAVSAGHRRLSSTFTPSTPLQSINTQLHSTINHQRSLLSGNILNGPGIILNLEYTLVVTSPSSGESSTDGGLSGKGHFGFVSR